MALEFPEAHVDMGEHRLDFEPDTPLGPSLEEMAFQELRETPEIREAAIKQLRSIVQEKGELELGLADDKLYMSFLRCCKFYPESAYDRLVNYYKFVGKHPKIFADLTPKRDHKAIKQNIFNLLPNRDKHGRRMLLIQAGMNWNVKEASLNDLIRATMLLIMGALVENKTQVAGATVIIDLKGLTINHVWQFSPATAKILLDYLQECLPCRLKAIHIVNHPMIFNMLFNIFKPFMNEKLRNRIHFHGNDKSQLVEAAGPKSVPIQYGGEMVYESIYGPQTWEMLCIFEDFYQKALDNKYIPSKKN